MILGYFIVIERQRFGQRNVENIRNGDAIANSICGHPEWQICGAPTLVEDDAVRNRFIDVLLAGFP